MKTTLNPFRAQHVRRLIVAVAITAGAAAFSTAVVLAEVHTGLATAAATPALLSSGNESARPTTGVADESAVTF